MITAPAAGADLHLFETDAGWHAFVPDGSRIYDVPAETSRELRRALVDGAEASELALAAFASREGPFIHDQPLSPPAIRSLSLNVAQACNLACGYCYAAGGDFGQPAQMMRWEVASLALDRLFQGTAPGERVRLAFLGGEPLLARGLIRRVTRRARTLAAQTGAEVGFAITTNGTLLREDDGDFFEEHGFAVSVSLDGLGAEHDSLRPLRNGTGTFKRIMANVRPLLRRQKRMQISARVTVTPQNLRLRQTLDGLIAAGFHSVGFAPVISAPNGHLQMETADLERLLEEMIDCGQAFERETIAGRRYPFSNMSTALEQLHRGTHRPYPCGAGAGYLSVSADGELFACHRFIGEPRAAMGSLTAGADDRRRVIWLTERHVDRQLPCSTCWARYLCGGGCHHEVLNRGRPACDYIRGWLHYCLQAYIRLSERCPRFFVS